MIEQESKGGPYEVACDGCSEDMEVDTDGDWSEMIAQIKNDGWLIRKVNETWEHYCPACAVAKGLRPARRI